MATQARNILSRRINKPILDESKLDPKSPEKLKLIHQKVNRGYISDKDNWDRFRYFRKFIYENSVSGDEAAVWTSMSKPIMQFPFLEPYISRAVGEFLDQLPSIYLSPKEGAKVDLQLIEFLQDYGRYILHEAHRENTQVAIFEDGLSGGFSAAEVFVDYSHSKSFEKVIRFRKEVKPTCTFWDSMAESKTRHDGEFCGRIHYFTEEEFRRKWPKIDIEQMQWSKTFGSFNWSFVLDNIKIIAVCEFYEKKYEKEKIVQIATGEVMTQDEYETLKQDWQREEVIEQLPIIIPDKQRDTLVPIICRYICIENQIIEYTQTNYNSFPLIFCDGNSKWLASSAGGSDEHLMTRPYPMGAKDAQRLKNYAGVCLADELQSMVQHKFMAALEGIPKQADYRNAYKDVQHAALLIYNQYANDDKDKPVNPPREIQRVPAPPEVMQAYIESERAVQGILGSFDSGQSLYQADLSGKAIEKGSIVSNSSLKPYINNYMISLTQIFYVILELLPKTIKTPRTMPVMRKNGKLESVMVNEKGGVTLNYDVQDLHIRIEAGVNTEIQKIRNIELLTKAGQMSAALSQFLGEEGADIIIKNLPMEGGDELEERYQTWRKQQAQQKQQMMQVQMQQMQNNPAIMRAQNESKKIDIDAKLGEAQLKLDAYELELQERDLQNKQLEAMVKAHIAKMDNESKIFKANAEELRAAADMAMKAADLHHKHNKDTLELHHKVNMDHHDRREAMKESDRDHDHRMKEKSKEQDIE